MDGIQFDWIPPFALVIGASAVKFAAGMNAVALAGTLIDDGGT